MRVKNHLPDGALALLLATLFLAGCDALGTTSAQPSPTATATTEASASPTPSIHGDWQTYTDPKYGFHLDVPALLSISFPVAPSGPDDSYVSWQYDPSKGPPPSGQALFAEITVGYHATDTLTGGNPNPCTVGRRITIGSGVTAYEDDNPNYPTPAPGGGASGPQGLDVNVVTGGVYLEISLFANPPTGTLRTRYGAIWQHILNSFVPGPPVPNTHPCG
ncbi:MAG TPA: hypothetical protein VH599_22500 [Ktedonobacterales bacterium]|jgi:hypothetical protein